MKLLSAVVLIGLLVGLTSAFPFVFPLAEADFIDDFYQTVEGCPYDYNKLLKLRTMVTDDMIWSSADNVTFGSGDIFAIYTCYPNSGVSMYDRQIIYEHAFYFDTTLVPGQPERHYVSNNDLLYNVSMNPITGVAITPFLTFFKECDDFVLVRNPNWQWGVGPSVPKFLVRAISSYASPRDFYVKLQLFKDGIIPPTKRTVNPYPEIKFWPLIPQNTYISTVNVTIAQMASFY